MNERIKELANQAGFHGESMFPVFGTTQETALNNFADLIIKEIDNLSFRGTGYVTSDGEDSIKTLICNHFVVEK